MNNDEQRVCEKCCLYDVRFDYQQPTLCILDVLLVEPEILDVL
jgi:hypothetical protein